MWYTGICPLEFLLVNVLCVRATCVVVACYLLSTTLDFPKEERMMQQSSVSISLSFENQGINPVGDNDKSPNTCTNNQQLAPNAIKGLSIPSRSLTRVRSERYDKIIFLVFL